MSSGRSAKKYFNTKNPLTDKQIVRFFLSIRGSSNLAKFVDQNSFSKTLKRRSMHSRLNRKEFKRERKEIWGPKPSRLFFRAYSKFSRNSCKFSVLRSVTNDWSNVINYDFSFGDPIVLQRFREFRKNSNDRYSFEICIRSSPIGEHASQLTDCMPIIICVISINRECLWKRWALAIEAISLRLNFRSLWMTTGLKESNDSIRSKYFARAIERSIVECDEKIEDKKAIF